MRARVTSHFRKLNAAKPDDDSDVPLADAGVGLHFATRSRYQMKIYIPSYKRPISVKTLAQFSAEAKRTVYIVVRPEEVNAYTNANPGVKVLPITAKVSDIGQTRQWIVEQHKGNAPFVMMDDDLTFARRNAVVRTKFSAALPEDIDSMLSDLEELLESVPHAGVLARQGANNVLDENAVFNTRMMRVLGYRPAALRKHAVRFDRNPPMEDFDVTLSLLRAGESNGVLTEYVQDHGSSNASGGCSEQRTLAKLAAAAYKLSVLHPGCVKVTQKTTKSGWGGTDVTRTDVIIAWKKAYASSGA